MKKLLLAGIVVFLFSISLAILQSSCSKSNAQTTQNGLMQLNKILYTKQVFGGSTGIEIWTANYDGSNAAQITITLPANVELSTSNQKSTPKLSPDGQTLFFVCHNSVSNLWSVYSCGIAGGQAHEIISSGTPALLEVYGAY